MREVRATLYGWRRPRLAAGVMLAAATLAAAALLVLALVGEPGERPPASAAVLLLALVGAVWLAFGLGLVVDLRLAGDELVWAVLFRSGRTPLADLRAVHAARLGSAVVVIEHAHGRLRALAVTRGLPDLARALQERQPTLPVDLPDVHDVDPRREG